MRVLYDHESVVRHVTYGGGGGAPYVTCQLVYIPRADGAYAEYQATNYKN